MVFVLIVRHGLSSSDEKSPYRPEPTTLPEKGSSNSLFRLDLMRRWRTTAHENSLPDRKSFTFNMRSGYFQSSAFTRTIACLQQLRLRDVSHNSETLSRI